MSKQTIKKIILSLTATMVLPLSAHASLIGDAVFIEVEEAILFPGEFDETLIGGFSTGAFVGAGAEFFVSFGDGTLNIDIDDTGIDLRFGTIGGFIFPDLSMTLTDLDWVDHPGFITDVTVVPGGDFALADLSFGLDEIHFTISEFLLPGVQGGSGVELLTRLEITAQHRTPDPEPAPVPEPATVLLLGTSLLGYGYYGRRRPKRGLC